MLLHSNKTDYNKIALLGAFCLFLSAAEYMIPKPFPFLRIGLANLPLMLALDVFSFRSFLILVCIKVAGQALITGTLFSYIFLFSLAGSFCSALLMFGLRNVFKKQISFIGIGTAAAVVSNAVQLLLAYFFIFKESVKYIAPVFLGTGLVTGVLLGVICEKIDIRKIFTARDAEHADGSINPHRPTVSRTNSQAYDLLKFITGLVLMPAILLIPSTEARVIIFLILWFLAILYKKKTNVLLTIIVIFSIIAFNLIIPHGKVLFSAGGFKITLGALTAGIHRAVTFQALVMLSKLTISRDLKLPGRFGKLLGESFCIFFTMLNYKPDFKGKSLTTINLTKTIDDFLFFSRREL